MTPRDRSGHPTLESPRSPQASGAVEKPANGEPAGAAAYAELLTDIRRRIAASRTRAAVAVNRELIELYWGIGREILCRQEERGWGAKVIDRLARDLKAEGHRGFSSRNLKYMRAFAQTWGEGPIVQQPVAQIPWGHNIRGLARRHREVHARAGWRADLRRAAQAAGGRRRRVLPRPPLLPRRPHALRGRGAEDRHVQGGVRGPRP